MGFSKIWCQHKPLSFGVWKVHVSKFCKSKTSILWQCKQLTAYTSTLALSEHLSLYKISQSIWRIGTTPLFLPNIIFWLTWKAFSPSSSHALCWQLLNHSGFLAAKLMTSWALSWMVYCCYALSWEGFPGSLVYYLDEWTVLSRNRWLLTIWRMHGCRNIFSRIVDKSYVTPVGDMSKSPSSQYCLKAQEDIDLRGIRVTNGSMR